MPLLKRVRVLAAKVEATPGVAESLVTGDAAHNVYDIDIQSSTTVTERPQQGGFNYMLSTVEGHAGTVSFKLNPYGNGLGGEGAWVNTFLPACGLVGGQPTAEAPGSNVKTLTIGVYENGVYKQLRGCAGDFTMTCATGKLIELEFTFTGIWDTPTDVAILAPTYPDVIPFRATGGLTLGSWTPCVESLTFAMGNTVVGRECQADDSGLDYSVVTDRKSTCTLNPEATLVATNDAYTDWYSSVNKALNYSIAQGSDNMALAINDCQITNIQEGDRNGIQVDDIELMVINDDFTLDFQ